MRQTDRQTCERKEGSQECGYQRNFDAAAAAENSIAHKERG